MNRARRRDMARRARNMDYARGRRADGRNPYGSEGGYVVSSRARGRRDMAMNDYGMDYAGNYNRGDMAMRRRDGNKTYNADNFEVYGWEDVNDDYASGDYARREDYARRGDYARRADYAGDYGYRNHQVPFELYGNVDMRNYNRDYGYDYAPRRMSGGRYMDYGYDYGEDEEEYLDDKELMDWSKKLLKEVPEEYKNYFTVDNIEKKAKEMGIEFKDFTFSEFYTTALMMVTDYSKTLGMSNIDIYLRLAKDWLCDEDVEKQYGEKLAKYYDEIVKD